MLQVVDLTLDVRLGGVAPALTLHKQPAMARR